MKTKRILLMTILSSIYIANFTAFAGNTGEPDNTREGKKVTFAPPPAVDMETHGTLQPIIKMPSSTNYINQPSTLAAPSNAQLTSGKHIKKRIKKTFSPSDDERLSELVAQFKSTQKGKRINWSAIARNMQDYSAKQCKERWENFLKPELEQPFNEEEGRVIIDGFNNYGADWNRISKTLEGRSPNEVKDKYLKIRADGNFEKFSVKEYSNRFKSFFSTSRSESDTKYQQEISQNVNEMWLVMNKELKTHDLLSLDFVTDKPLKNAWENFRYASLYEYKTEEDWKTAGIIHYITYCSDGKFNLSELEVGFTFPKGKTNLFKVWELFAKKIIKNRGQISFVYPNVIVNPEYWGMVFKFKRIRIQPTNFIVQLNSFNSNSQFGRTALFGKNSEGEWDVLGEFMNEVDLFNMRGICSTIACPTGKSYDEFFLKFQDRFSGDTDVAILEKFDILGYIVSIAPIETPQGDNSSDFFELDDEEFVLGDLSKYLI